MASTLQHLTIARRINDIYFNFKGNELSEFLLGSIVCDAPKKDITKNITTGIKMPDTLERKSARAYTHYLRPSTNENKKEIFISSEIASIYGYNPVDDNANSVICYEQFCPMIKYFINKYYDYFKEPFMIGYLIHLITDDLYFRVITPMIINDNIESINSFINEKYFSLGYKKKEYISNGEYLAWTHHFLYEDYNKYNTILTIKYENKIPDFYNLSRYLRNWEESNKSFKPSMIEDLNDTESMISFIENANNLAKNIRLIKQNIKFNNAIKNQTLYYITYDYYEKLEKETENIFKEIYYNIDKYKI